MREYSRAEIEAYEPGGTIKVEGNDIQVHGALGSGPIWVDADDQSITPHLKQEPFWESWITAWHTKHLEEYETYIDLGANSGYFSVLATHYGLKVIAIEANPRYVELLLKTEIDQIKQDHHFVVWKVAISDKKGSVRLNLPETLHGGASIMGTAVPTTQSVLVKTDTLHRINNPVGEKILMKMDIEGAEEKAFDGSRDWLEENNVDLILEYTPRAYSPDFFDKLVEYGDVRVVDFDGNEQPITKEQANSEPDWITLTVKRNV